MSNQDAQAYDFRAHHTHPVEDNTPVQTQNQEERISEASIESRS